MRYFEDVEAGETEVLGSHTLTQAEIIAFARRYDPQPFHIDPEAARATIFGGLIASGWHTCAIMMRLSVEAARRREAAITGSPGVDSCRWLKPVRPGDTVTARSEVLATWPSRSKPIGFVRCRIEMVNQRGEAVLDLVGVSMYRRGREQPA
jgi:acyl dehydratase